MTVKAIIKQDTILNLIWSSEMSDIEEPPSKMSKYEEVCGELIVFIEIPK